MTARQQTAHEALKVAERQLRQAVIDAETSGLQVQINSGRPTYTRRKEINPLWIFTREKS